MLVQWVISALILWVKDFWEFVQSVFAIFTILFSIFLQSDFLIFLTIWFSIFFPISFFNVSYNLIFYFFHNLIFQFFECRASENLYNLILQSIQRYFSVLQAQPSKGSTWTLSLDQSVGITRLLVPYWKPFPEVTTFQGDPNTIIEWRCQKFSVSETEALFRKIFLLLMLIPDTQEA